MTLRIHWLAWRRDVVALAILCAAAVVFGLLINWTGPRLHSALASWAPGLARHVTIDADASDSSLPPLTQADPWTYRAPISPGQRLWVRNVVGPVSVEPTTGSFVEIRAVKSFRRSDPASVALVATPNREGLAVCAVGVDSLVCAPGVEITGPHRHSDVAVAFTIRVPYGVRIDIATVSGAVHVRGASAPVTVRTVNGAVDAETDAGPVNAVTVNGSVRAIVRGFGDTGSVQLATVNGAVTAELPAHLDAVIEAATLHGRVVSDFPLTLEDALVAHRASGTVGTGGRKVELHTVNGSVRLLEVPPKP